MTLRGGAAMRTLPVFAGEKGATCFRCELPAGLREARGQGIFAHAMWCSEECRDAYRRSALVQKRQLESEKRKERIGPTTADVGTASELLVSAEMVARGFHVFRSVSATASCDLVVVYQDRCLRVEVKTGKILRRGSLQYGQPIHSGYDVLAVCIPQDRIYYFSNNDIPVTLETMWSVLDE